MRVRFARALERREDMRRTAMEGYAGTDREWFATILIPKQADQDARRLCSVSGKSAQWVGQSCPTPYTDYLQNDPRSRVEGLMPREVSLSRIDARRLKRKHLLRPLSRNAPTTAHAAAQGGQIRPTSRKLESSPQRISEPATI